MRRSHTASTAADHVARLDRCAAIRRDSATHESPSSKWCLVEVLSERRAVQRVGPPLPWVNACRNHPALEWTRPQCSQQPHPWRRASTPRLPRRPRRLPARRSSPALCWTRRPRLSSIGSSTSKPPRNPSLRCARSLRAGALSLTRRLRVGFLGTFQGGSRQDGGLTGGIIGGREEGEEGEAATDEKSRKRVQSSSGPLWRRVSS